MQFDGKRVIAAAVIAVAATGNAAAATDVIARTAPAASPRQAPAHANAMANETSPYHLLLLGAGVMVLVGRSSRKDAPWAPSPVE